jgi:hypothetical protein
MFITVAPVATLCAYVFSVMQIKGFYTRLLSLHFLVIYVNPYAGITGFYSTKP